VTARDADPDTALNKLTSRRARAGAERRIHSADAG
jgi:hypothetical protein